MYGEVLDIGVLEKFADYIVGKFGLNERLTILISSLIYGLMPFLIVLLVFLLCRSVFIVFKDRALEKKRLEEYVSYYKHSKTLVALMENRDLLLKKLKTLKYKIYFTLRRKKIMKALELELQLDIRYVNKTWYENIVEAIELGQATYAKSIYENAMDFYLAIKKYNSIFDDANRTYSSIIMEKLPDIIAFTEKYRNASNFGTNDKKLMECQEAILKNTVRVY